MNLESYLETTDLQTLHVILSITGVMLSTHLMQLAWHNPEEGGLAMRLLRRGNLAVAALAMIWSLCYASDRNWQPWPPALLIMATVDTMMLMRIVVIYHVRRQRRRSRPRCPAHRHHHERIL